MPEIIEDTSVNELFDRGYALYEKGEPYENLIPLFKDVCNGSPKSAAAWSCLAWLYLLTGQGDLALKAAKRAVKADATAPQARINLVLAMLELGEKGVREHIEMIQRINDLDEEVKQSVVDNINDGLTRKPDWKHLKKVQQWLELQ
jgi:tetratricopeptide (TPR) repeat protein